MIKIDKSKFIPSKLNNEGVIETNKLKLLYEKSPDDFTSSVMKSKKAVSRFTFDNKIYGDNSVKNQLIQDQNEKCCFCEAVFNANGFGDVEHFRPKAAYKVGKQLKYPAYYWLVYDWENLMFSCQKCNQEFKANEFPVLNENTRVKNHLDTNQIDNELNILINPIKENPENYIYFLYEIPKPKINLNLQDKLRASETIRIFGLARKELNRDRLEYLKILKILKPFLNFDLTNQAAIENAKNVFKISDNELKENITNAITIYANSVKKSSKFAGMVRSNFPDLKINN